VDLGRDAVEENAPLALHRPGATGEQSSCQLLHDCAAVLAANLLAAIGDLQRRRQDTLSVGRDRGRAASPKSDGRSAATSSDLSARRS